MMKKKNLECRMYDPDFFNDLYYFIHPYRKMDADTRDCNDQSDRRRKSLILPSIFPKVAIIPIQI